MQEITAEGKASVVSNDKGQGQLNKLTSSQLNDIELGAV